MPSVLKKTDVKETSKWADYGGGGDLLIGGGKKEDKLPQKQ